MRHYEIVVLIHPDQGDQMDALLERYQGVVTDRKGHIHRLEHWGRRQLAYPIQGVHKAYYVLLNIECDQDALTELKTTFRYSDAVIRHLCLRMDEAVTGESPMAHQRARSESSDRGISKRDDRTDRAPRTERKES